MWTLVLSDLLALSRCKELEEQLRTLQSSSEEKLIAVQAECQVPQVQ